MPNIDTTALKKDERIAFFGEVLANEIKVAIEEWEQDYLDLDWLIYDIKKALRSYEYKVEDLNRLFDGRPLQREEQEQKDKEAFAEIKRLDKLIEESQEKQRKILEELGK